MFGGLVCFGVAGLIVLKRNAIAKIIAKSEPLAVLMIIIVFAIIAGVVNSYLVIN